MNSRAKHFCIIVLAVLITFSFTACNDSGGGGDSYKGFIKDDETDDTWIKHAFGDSLNYSNINRDDAIQGIHSSIISLFTYNQSVVNTLVYASNKISLEDKHLIMNKLKNNGYVVFYKNVGGTEPHFIAAFYKTN